MHAHASPSTEVAFPAPDAEESPVVETEVVSNESAPCPDELPLSATARFLAGPADAIDLRTEALRFAAGAGLSALYGVALGVRAGGGDLLRHAAGVPAALLAVAALGVPALFIVLALFNAPLDPPRVVAAAARASASAGLLLAGFAPAAALFVLSSERAEAAAFAGAAGLLLGGLAGVSRLLRELGRSLSSAPEGARAASGVAFAAFAIFAAALAARVWWSALPILGGVQ